MTKLVAAKHTWTEGRFCSGLALEVSGGTLRRVRRLGTGEVADLEVEIIAPALADLQVNGSGGVMFNSEPTADSISQMVSAQQKLGTGWIMPTLITCEQDLMEKAAEAAIEAWGTEGFIGLHLEGPHLNRDRKGTHKAEFVRPFGYGTLAVLERLRNKGVPVMLTLAPEKVPSEMVRRLVEMGVIVSAGHSAATGPETEAALAAGISCFTHLFNAMPPMLSREPGIVATAINSNAFAGIIVDGHHVSWEMIKLACKARPRPKLMFMVSDAMSTVGGPDHFVLYGETIAVREGALVNSTGTLAGAHVDLVTSLANAVRHVKLPVAEAYEMAAVVPWDVIGMPRPDLVPGIAVRNLLALDADLNRVALQ
jgi:N-acetylglucosamine-6-phosphate deacetylase